MMEINGMEVITNGFFAFDGCHKIYICENDGDVEKMKEYGYDILPISQLPETYAESCPLKFINNVELDKQYARQCEEAEFEGF